MEYKLKKGQALVLVGKEGCGKSTLARSIASLYARYVEVDARQFDGPFGLWSVLESQPKTVIVDGFPALEYALSNLKTLISNDEVLCDRRLQPPKAVKSPNFIFCSGSVDHLPEYVSDRRFFVVNLDKPSASKHLSN